MSKDIKEFPPKFSGDDLLRFFESKESSDAPVLLVVIYGLCNRLRALLSFIPLARRYGRRVEILWKPDDNCPCTFAEVFEPISGVIVHDAPEDCDATAYALRVQSGCPFNHERIWDELVPVPECRRAIRELITKLDPYDAVHVRRTDTIELSASSDAYHVRRLALDEAQCRVVLSRFGDASSRKVYVASDNRESQDFYKERLGERAVFHKKVGRDLGETHRRHTTIRDAVIDLFMCGFSQKFVGSGSSSFTVEIQSMRGHCTRKGRRLAWFYSEEVAAADSDD